MDANDKPSISFSQAIDGLLRSLPEISSLMLQRYVQVNGRPEPGSDLDQSGLVDGDEIVRDFIDNREPQLALEHLIYMVEEAHLTISAETYSAIMAAASVIEIDPRILDRFTKQSA